MNQTTQQNPVPAVLVLQETALKDILQTSLNDLKAEIRELIEQVTDQITDQIKDPKSDKDLITSNELCALLQTNKPQLWKWTQKGLLNPVRLTENGKLFYRKSEVLESLKETRTVKRLKQKQS